MIESGEANDDFDALVLACDPLDPGVLWAGGRRQDGVTLPAVAWCPVDVPAWNAVALPGIGVDYGQIEDLAPSPTVPGCLYAGGGLAAVSGYQGVLFRSRDGGEVWEEAVAGRGAGRILDLGLHPEDPDILFLARESGLARSLDGGETATTLYPGTVEQVAVDPWAPELVWASGPAGGVRLSRDGGDTWETAGTELPDITLSELLLDGEEPGIVYAALEGAGIRRLFLDDHPAPAFLAGVTVDRRAGEVVLRWRLTDPGAGCHVWRGDARPAVRLTDVPLAGPGWREFVDVAAPAGEPAYWLELLGAGEPTWFGPWRAPRLAPALTLGPARPNPFNPRTTIPFRLPAATRVRLEVVDVRGRAVAVLVDDETLPAGLHAARWDGRDGRGRAVASGVYRCRLAAGGRVLSRPLLLLR